MHEPTSTAKGKLRKAEAERHAANVVKLYETVPHLGPRACQLERFAGFLT